MPVCVCVWSVQPEDLGRRARVVYAENDSSLAYNDPEWFLTGSLCYWIV